MLSLLTPSSDEIEALARRETDPRHAASFEPLAIGMLPTMLALAAVGIAAAIANVPRLCVRLLRAGARR